MLKIKTFVIIIIIYLIAFISLKTNINLFYPFYLLKDLVFLPVEAIKTEEEFKEDKLKDSEYYQKLQRRQ